MMRAKLPKPNSGKFSNGPDGNSVKEESRGVAIWKKQPDGSWKCVMDVMSPAAPLDVK
jgi:ketosteroid isomerase-like protein